MNVDSISSAKRNLNSIAASKTTTAITINGKKVSVLLSYDEYKRLRQKEKELLLRTLQERAKKIQRGEIKLLTQEELDKSLGFEPDED